MLEYKNCGDIKTTLVAIERLKLQKFIRFSVELFLNGRAYRDGFDFGFILF